MDSTSENSKNGSNVGQGRRRTMGSRHQQPLQSKRILPKGLSFDRSTQPNIHVTPFKLFRRLLPSHRKPCNETDPSHRANPSLYFQQPPYEQDWNDFISTDFDDEKSPDQSILLGLDLIEDDQATTTHCSEDDEATTKHCSIPSKEGQRA